MRLLDKSGWCFIDIKNQNGDTALIQAAEIGNAEAVKLLLDKGADVNVRNGDGKTALNLAKTEEIMRLLRAAGAK